MKKLILTSVLTMCFAASALANEVTGNVALTTEYVFRGVSQSDENPAIQGGVDFTHDTGLHAGLWGSSIDFNTPDAGSLEVDLYAGYANQIAGVSYDIGGIYYAYPGSDSDLDYDFIEGYIKLGYDFDVAAVHAGVYYSPEFFGDTGNAFYYTAGVKAPVMDLFNVSVSVGRQEIDDADDYTDWSLGIDRNWLGFDWSAAYIDTDIDNNDNADARAVLKVGKTF